MRGIAVATFMALALAGCDKPANQSEIRALQGGINDLTLEDTRLQARIVELERQREADDAMIKSLGKAVDGLSAQVNSNARVANENAVSDMTAAGLCGKETVYFEGGGYTIRNRKCTVKDLKR